MSTPTDLPPDELRTLRERAYGRDADIHDDPAALARLRELEAQAAAARDQARDGAHHGASTAGSARDSARTSAGDGTGSAVLDTPGSTAAVVAAAREESAPRSPLEDATDADARDPDGGDLPGDGEPDAGAGPRWWWRRIPLLWAATSVVIALLIGAGATLGIQALSSGRVAVLQEVPDGEWPDTFFGPRPANGRVFEDFHGLIVLAFPQKSDEGGSQACLYVLTSPSGSGFGAVGCGAGSFPATVSMEVVGASPRELRDRFPEGTALQFVLEESGVHVYARAPGIVEPTP